MAVTVQKIFDNIRQEMDDVQGNTYSDTVLLVPFNRIYRDLNLFLAEIGAEIARKGPISIDLTVVNSDITDPSTIAEAMYESSDVSTKYYRWTLQVDFMAFVRDDNDSVYARLRKADGTMAIEGLPQYDGKYVDRSRVPIHGGLSFEVREGIPGWLYVWTDGDAQYVAFDVIPKASEVTELVYYYFPKVSDKTDPDAESMPWQDLLNDVFHAELLIWARHWKEWTTAMAQEQKLRARNMAQEILGLRVNDEVNVTPSMWGNFPA